ncbi:MAG: hypothetical protein ACRCVA_20700 [Phreatobacter sp.]
MKRQLRSAMAGMSSNEPTGRAMFGWGMAGVVLLVLMVLSWS